MILPDGNYAMGKFVPDGSTLVPAKPNGPHTWDGSQWVFDGYTTEDAMNRLRSRRNRLLAKSDWMAVSDRTITQAQIDYRQALRDLPETADPQLDEQGNLTNVTWPERPE